MTSSPHRFTALAGLVTLSLAAISCGGSDGGTSSKQLRMGIAVANVSLNFAVEMSNGAKQAATDAGNIDFQVVGPPSNDGPAEVQQFQNLAATATDGIILENLNPPLFTRPAAEAVARRIPVVALDTSPTQGSNVEFYVGNDNYDLGVQMATELLRRLPANPTGVVVVGVPDPGAPVLDFRSRGIKDTLVKQAPGIEVLGPFETYSEPTKNYGSWSAQVNAHPDALAFLGVGDADSYDLARLKQEKSGTWLTAGFDVDGKTLQAVKSGQNFITMDPEHYLKGYLASALLIDSVRKGKDLPKGWFVSPGFVITKDNVDAIIAREATAEAALAWYKPTIDKLLADPQASVKPLGEAR